MKELLIKVSIACGSRVVDFLQGKVLCIDTHQQAICKMLIDFIGSD